MNRLRVAIVILWLICFGIAEVACRLFLAPPGFQAWPAAHVPGLRSPHPTRGFAHTQNFAGRRVTTDYNTALVTNALGMRDGPVVIEGATRRILAVGDSFTEGMGVEQQEAWPARLEHVLSASRRVRVFNAGVTAYSPVQMRQTADELIPVVKPGLLIAGIFPFGCTRLSDPYVLVGGIGGDTVRQSALYRLRPAPGGLRYSAFHAPRLVMLDLWLSDHSWFLGHLVHQAQRVREGVTAAAPVGASDPPLSAIHPLLAEIDRLHDVAREAGIPLALLLINAQEPDGQFKPINAVFNETIRSHAAGRGLLVVDPLPLLIRAAHGRRVMRFPSDGHWTALAHAVAGDEVAAVLVQRQPAGLR